MERDGGGVREMERLREREEREREIGCREGRI